MKFKKWDVIRYTGYDGILESVIYDVSDVFGYKVRKFQGLSILIWTKEFNKVEYLGRSFRVGS